jgi:type VI secretion system protein ImpA
MIEVKKLVRPVSSENPVGESLRYSPIYDQIRAARREDDASLPQGIWQTKLKKADWQEVKNICMEALENRSKDLQIGAWLLEACIHLDGFAGVGDGFRVLTALCENFWETMHPALDPDEPEYRFGPIIWIDEKLTLALKLIPITHPKTDDELSYTWAHWESAQFQAQASAKASAKERKKEKKARQGTETLEKPLEERLTASVTLTPTDFYTGLNRELSVAFAEISRFEQVLIGFDKKQEGALHQMRGMLRTIGHFVGEILKDRGAGIPEKPENKTSIVEEQQPRMAEETEQGESREVISTGGPIRNRAQAYQMLAEAADYLMKTEPHSPTPYLVKRAVAWGNMSLGELLGQVLRNPGELTELSRLLGIDEFTDKGKK